MAKVGDLLSNCIEAGVYELNLVSLDRNTPSKAGDDMLTIVWEEGSTGVQIYDRMVVTEKVFFKFAQVYVALGGDPDDDAGSIEDFANVCYDMLLDKGAVLAKVGVRKWEGVNRNEITQYLTEEAAETARLNEESPF